MADRMVRRGAGQRGEAYRHRANARQRGYTTTYDKARRVKLGRHPLCQVCESMGLVVEAAETHHVVPAAADRSMVDDISNLLSVCHRHHDEVEGMTWRQLQSTFGVYQFDSQNEIS